MERTARAGADDVAARGWQRQTLRVADAWIDASAAAILIVADGRLRLATREYALVLDQGTVLVHDGREPLRLRAGSGYAATLVQLRDACCAAADAGPVAGNDVRLLPVIHDADSAAARELIARLGCEEAAACADAESIDATVARFAAAQRRERDAIDRCNGRSASRRLEQYVRLSRARALLAWGEGESPDVARVADIARLSPAHFVRLFHRVFEVPPHRYRIERRMQLAHRMIRGTQLPVGEIVRQLGLGSHSTFSRVFRREFGMSATRLRALWEMGDAAATATTAQ
jgi:AraC family transcriptional regulator